MNTTLTPDAADQPLVSVVITTYQHEDYIAQCIESALAQITSFPVEILIGVDDGGDRTLAICQQYAQQYPGRVQVHVNDPGNVLLIRGRRVGRYNFLNVFYKARGKYIAICDGDDYWCDNHKLQRQADLLEADPQASACHHWQHCAIPDEQGVYHVEDAPRQGHGYLPDPQATVRAVFENRLRLKSRTVMYRNLFARFPDYIYQVAYADVALSVLYGLRGHFLFIDEPMAVYRLTGKGVSTSGYGEHFAFRHRIDYIDLWERSDLFAEGQYRAEARQTILHYYREIFDAYKYSSQALSWVLRYSLLQSVYPFWLRLVMTRDILQLYTAHRSRKKKRKKKRR